MHRWRVFVTTPESGAISAVSVDNLLASEPMRPYREELLSIGPAVASYVMQEIEADHLGPGIPRVTSMLCLFMPELLRIDATVVHEQTPRKLIVHYFQEYPEYVETEKDVWHR